MKTKPTAAAQSVNRVKNVPTHDEKQISILIGQIRNHFVELRSAFEQRDLVSFNRILDTVDRELNEKA